MTTSTNIVERCGRQLRQIFASLIPRDVPVALVDFPVSANCGEHAVWLGEKKLLFEFGLSVVYECSGQTYDPVAMRAKIGGGTILIHGGANFGDRYPLHDEFRSRVLKDFPSNKIILFPQQVTFLDDDYLKRTADSFAVHRDVTLFARGSLAHQQLSRFFGAKARVELAPDMAFLLGEQKRLQDPLYDIVWLARTDEERADQAEVAARLSSQGAEKFSLPPFPDGIELGLVVRQRPPTILLTDWMSLVFDNVEARLAFGQLDFDTRSQIYLSRSLHILSLGHIVITDRLHGHVLCLMLGIPHIFLNNDSGKNWNFYETWTRDSPLCRLARNAQDAWMLARNALPKLKEGSGEWSWQSAGASVRL